MAAKTPDQITDDLLRPLEGASGRYWTALAFFGGIVIAALCTFGWQVYAGIGVAGIRRPVFWGFYITDFVFWIGLSHAGTLISAILRLANATWRRPVTRCAEVITVFALSIGATFPIIHLGRPWLAFWLFPYPSERGIWPNIRSPLLWDFFAINTYLTRQRHIPVAAHDSGHGADSRSRHGPAQENLFGCLHRLARHARSSGIAWNPPCRSWPSP